MFRYERWVDGELSRDGISELFDIARHYVDTPGTVTEAFDEWLERRKKDEKVTSAMPADIDVALKAGT